MFSEINIGLANSGFKAKFEGLMRIIQKGISYIFPRMTRVDIGLHRDRKILAECRNGEDNHNNIIFPSLTILSVKYILNHV